MYELKWSHAEKTVARRAFDLALGEELEALLQEAKGRAARIEEPSELWNLESWLTERRREIDRRYDYRYSILPLVFAQLLRDGRLTFLLQSDGGPQVRISWRGIGVRKINRSIVISILFIVCDLAKHGVTGGSFIRVRRDWTP